MISLGPENGGMPTELIGNWTLPHGRTDGRSKVDWRISATEPIYDFDKGLLLQLIKKLYIGANLMTHFGQLIYCFS